MKTKHKQKTKTKKQPQIERQYFYNTYPTKDLKPEYIKTIFWQQGCELTFYQSRDFHVE